MRAIYQFIKTMVIGGVLFLLPVIVIVLLLYHAMKAVASVIHPAAEAILPTETVGGLAVVDVLAVLGLLAVGFVAGLIARTPGGRRVQSTLEALVLGKMPGYTLLKSVTTDKQDLGVGADVRVVLARLDEAWLLAFVMEQHPDGLLTVFVPSTPTPLAGSLYFLREDQVRTLDVPVATAIKCIMQLGVGAAAVLETGGARTALDAPPVSAKQS